MMRMFAFRNAGLPLAAATTFLAAVDPSAATAARVHTIIIDKMKFVPASSHVRSGDTVLWVNKDMVRHTATARDKSFNLTLAPGTSAKTVVTRAGSITFYCSYHPGMRGVLIVGN